MILEKRWIILLSCFVILIFSGCSSPTESPISTADSVSEKEVSATDSDKVDISMQKITYIEKDVCTIDWNQVEVPVDKSRPGYPKNTDPFDTKEEATEIGQSIIENYHALGKIPNYELLYISHYVQDNIWVFEYAIDNIWVEADVFYVAMNGNTGEIIKVWYSY